MHRAHCALQSVEAQKLRDFRSAGVNRISLGVQSLVPGALEYLGRNHTVKVHTHGTLMFLPFVCLT